MDGRIDDIEKAHMEAISWQEYRDFEMGDGYVIYDEGSWFPQ